MAAEARGQGSALEAAPPASGLHRVAGTVATLNLGYFGIEFTVALAVGSVSLFADSVDFLEDALVNLLIVAALGWSIANRARRHGEGGRPARPSSPSWREPDPGGVPLVAKRRVGQRPHCRGWAGHEIPVAVGMARLAFWARNQCGAWIGRWC